MRRHEHLELPTSGALRIYPLVPLIAMAWVCLRAINEQGSERLCRCAVNQAQLIGRIC